MRGPRSRKVDLIDAECDRRLVAGVTGPDGHKYHTDDRFLSELMALVLGYQAGVLTGIQAIRTMENQILQLDAAQLVSLAQLVGAHRQAAYADCWAAKDALPPE